MASGICMGKRARDDVRVCMGYTIYVIFMACIWHMGDISHLEAFG